MDGIVPRRLLGFSEAAINSFGGHTQLMVLFVKTVEICLEPWTFKIGLKNTSDFYAG